MKKIFTTLFCAVMCTASSLAAITVTAGGKTVENGSEIVLTKDDFKVMQLGPTMCRITAAVELQVSTTNAPLDFTARTDNAQLQCCPEQCIEFGDTPGADGFYTGTKHVNSASVTCPVDVAFMQASNEIPVMKSTMIVEIKDGASSTFQVRVVFNTKDAGVDAVEKDAESLTVSGNVLNYNVEGEQVVNVYDLSGNSVFCAPIAGAGSLSLASLPAGLYIVSTPSCTIKVTLQ